MLTSDYAEQIGADFYAKDAAESARIAERFFAEGKKLLEGVGAFARAAFACVSRVKGVLELARLLVFGALLSHEAWTWLSAGGAIRFSV